MSNYLSNKTLITVVIKHSP